MPFRIDRTVVAAVFAVAAWDGICADQASKLCGICAGPPCC